MPNHIQQSQSETEILTSNLLRQYDACNKIDENSTYLDNDSHPYDISDDYELMDLRIRKLQERKHLWSTDNVRKEFSPMVTALMRSAICYPVIDEESEVNCIREELVLNTDTKYVPTTCSASAADSTNMKVVGQTKSDIVLTLLHDNQIVWQLGKCVVIGNLSYFT